MMTKGRVSVGRNLRRDTGQQWHLLNVVKDGRLQPTQRTYIDEGQQHNGLPELTLAIEVHLEVQGIEVRNGRVWVSMAI